MLQLKRLLTHTHTQTVFILGRFCVDVVYVVVVATVIIIIIMNISRLRAVCLFPYASNYLEALCEQLLRAILCYVSFSL